MRWIKRNPWILWWSLLVSALAWGGVVGLRVASADESTDPPGVSTTSLPDPSPAIVLPEVPADAASGRPVPAGVQDPVPAGGSIPWGPLSILGSILGWIAWGGVELLKGLSKRFAASPTACKAAAAGMFGVLLGILAYLFIPGPWKPLEAILAGLTGAGVSVGVRTGGKALQGDPGPRTPIPGGPTLPLLIACLGLILLPACGSTFTAKQGVQIEIKPIAPSSAVITCDGKLACQVLNPTGPIDLKVSCPAGKVQWYTVAGSPTCIADPCVNGKRLSFDPAGEVKCAD